MPVHKHIILSRLSFAAFPMFSPSPFLFFIFLPSSPSLLRWLCLDDGFDVTTVLWYCVYVCGVLWRCFYCVLTKYVQYCDNFCAVLWQCPSPCSDDVLLRVVTIVVSCCDADCVVWSQTRFFWQWSYVSEDVSSSFLFIKDFWGGLPDKVDAAVQWSDNFIYFFRHKKSVW